MLKKERGSIVNISSVGVLDHRPAEPLRLWRDQGRGDRADQGGGRRFHPAGHPLQRDLPGHHRIALARGADRDAGGKHRTVAGSGACKALSTVSRWAGWARHRKWRRLRYSWLRTSRATSPASRIWSMAGSRCKVRTPPEASMRDHHRSLLLLALAPGLALAANCKRNGNAVTCDDGRTGIFAGDAIVWPDGTRSSSAQHPSVHHRAQGFGARRAGRVRRLAVGHAARSRSTIRTRRTSATAPCSTASLTVSDGIHTCTFSSPARPA